MFCPNCGHDMKDDLKFCPNCGAQIENGKIVSSREEGARTKEVDREYELVSMVCGILSLLIPFFNIILGIIACVFSGKANNKTSYSKVGKITGIIGIVLGALELIAVIFWIVVFALSMMEPTPAVTTYFYLA